MSREKKNETVGIYPTFCPKRLRGITDDKNDNKYNNTNTR